MASHQLPSPALRLSRDRSTELGVCSLFEKYNVDLALESDGHCIKRTVPIRNGKQDNWVVYVGEGGLELANAAPNKTIGI